MQRLGAVRRRWPAPASTLVTCLLPAEGDAVRFRVDGWTVSHTRAPGEPLADAVGSLDGRTIYGVTALALRDCIPTVSTGTH